MEYHQLTALAREYDAAVTNGDVPRAGRIISNLLNRLRNMDPETVKAAIAFFKAILGEFGLMSGPSALTAPLSADQLLQPGIITDTNEIGALWAREEIARTAHKQATAEGRNVAGTSGNVGDTGIRPNDAPIIDSEKEAAAMEAKERREEEERGKVSDAPHAAAADNQSRTKLALGAWAELAMLLFTFIRQIRQQPA